jgi:hypothetical protein
VAKQGNPNVRSGRSMPAMACVRNLIGHGLKYAKIIRNPSTFMVKYIFSQTQRQMQFLYFLIGTCKVLVPETILNEVLNHI